MKKLLLTLGLVLTVLTATAKEFATYNEAVDYGEEMYWRCGYVIMETWDYMYEVIPKNCDKRISPIDPILQGNGDDID